MHSHRFYTWILIISTAICGLSVSNLPLYSCVAVSPSLTDLSPTISCFEIPFILSFGLLSLSHQELSCVADITLHPTAHLTIDTAKQCNAPAWSIKQLENMALTNRAKPSVNRIYFVDTNNKIKLFFQALMQLVEAVEFVINFLRTN